ncbi:MAG: MBL fold metallo-hydrolase [Eubacteriaceae bacterium]|nr:MBL fold metallo-hydrolase [Eubacteriaceae bacterium]
MYELIKAGKNSYYIDCPAKIGIYEAAPGEVYLIDSGNDKDAAVKVRRILEKNGWSLKGILITHSNCDHIGGCDYLSKHFACKVFAPGVERAFTENTVLEPAFLYGGFPPSDLRHKFLMAKPCETHGFDDPDFPLEVGVIPLPGHFFDMVGFLLPDGTAFIADCLSSEQTLQKYKVTFIYDVAQYLKTLGAVQNIGASLYIPSHAPACEDISPLAACNRRNTEEISLKLLEICASPINFEAVLQRVFTDYGLKMNFEQYVLVGSTIKSFLSYLKEEGKLTVFFENNMLYWKAN